MNGAPVMVQDKSVIAMGKGYYQGVVTTGYQMYYFTIVAGKTQKSLEQYFEPQHAGQLKTILGISDMINKFK